MSVGAPKHPDLPLGVETVVRRRRLLLCDEVRIHLDEVEGLGCFLELQAEVPPGCDLAPVRSQLNILCQVLEIEDDDLIAESYADLRLRDVALALAASSTNSVTPISHLRAYTQGYYRHWNQNHQSRCFGQ